MRRLIVTLVLLAPGPTFAAPPKAPGTVVVRVGEITSVEIAGDPGKEVAWAPGFAPEACFVDEGKPLRKDTARLFVMPKAPGVHRVVLWTVGEKEYTTLVVDASGAGPRPPDPKVDPRPDPKVDPPAPDLPAAPDDKARVLMIRSANDLSAQTEARKAVFDGAKVRDYLDAKLGQDMYRAYNHDVVFPAGSASPYKALMGRPRTGNWWLVITKGGRIVHEGELPATPDAALALFRKFFGD